MTKTHNKTILALAVTLALSACGGSGLTTAPVPDIKSGETTNPSAIRLPNMNADDTATIKVNNTSAVSNTSSTFSKEAVEHQNAAKNGSGSTILLVDNGLDRNNDIVKTMDTNAQMYVANTLALVKKENAHALDNSKHGAEMVTVMSKYAPDVRVEALGFVSRDIGVVGVSRNVASVLRDNPEIDIINNSYTDKTQGDVGFYRNRVDAVSDAINNHNVLWVSATGNGNHNNPDDSALLPFANSKIDGGFLAVTAIHDGKQVFNACGDAKNHCITAPTTFTMTDKGKQYEVWGTSTSTAVVSAIAANVKSNFDFMNGKQLADVLTTTATDIGISGVDNLYGHGLVNADKALGGYGRFDKEVNLNVNGKKDRYHFTNDITGEGSLVKSGQDTLVLSGRNTYKGSTTVKEGVLVANGRSNSHHIVESGAKLSVGDNENISVGGLTNNGQVIANTKSDLNVNGNLTLTEQSDLQKSIGSKINVNGNAYLNGKLTVSGVAEGYATKAGQTETLLSATNIVGKFNSVESKVGDLIDNRVSVGKNNVTVTTSRKEVGRAIETASQFKGIGDVAQTTEQALSVIDTRMDNNVALNEKETRFAQTMSQSRNLGQTLFEMSHSTHQHAQESLSVDEIKQNARMIDYALNNKQGAWLDYAHNGGKIKLNGLQTDGKNNEFNLGLAHTFDNKHQVVASLHHGKQDWSETHQNSNKSVETNSYGFDLAYILPFGSMNVYSNLGYNWLIQDKNNQDNKGKQYAFGLGVNKTYALSPNWVIRPDVSIQHVETEMKDIKMTNDVELNKLKTKQTTLMAGFKTQYNLNPKTSLFAGLNLEQDVNKKTQANVSYAGIKTQNSNNTIGKTRVNINAGVHHKINKEFDFVGSVSHQQGKSWKNNQVNVGVNYRF